MSFVPKPKVDYSHLEIVVPYVASPALAYTVTIPMKFGERDVVVIVGIPVNAQFRNTLDRDVLKKIGKYIADAVEEKGGQR